MAWPATTNKCGIASTLPCTSNNLRLPLGIGSKYHTNLSDSQYIVHCNPLGSELGKGNRHLRKF